MPRFSYYIYLGDSVYAHMDDLNVITVFLNNGERSLADTLIEKNPIVLDPSMVDTLNNWVKEQQNKTNETN